MLTILLEQAVADGTLAPVGDSGSMDVPALVSSFMSFARLSEVLSVAQTEAYQAAAADPSSPFGEFAAELDTTSAELRELGLTRYSVSLPKSLDTLATSGTAWVIPDGNYAQIDLSEYFATPCTTR